jgi:hypothetical protein
MPSLAESAKEGEMGKSGKGQFLDVSQCPLKEV